MKTACLRCYIFTTGCKVLSVTDKTKCYVTALHLRFVPVRLGSRAAPEPQLVTEDTELKTR